MKNKRQRFYPCTQKAKPYPVAKAATISLCMIVKNEADHLPNCLKSIRPAVDEMIVVDTGSTDNTQEIARENGAAVFEFPWCGDFSAARNASIERATGDYILWLDADDVIEPNEAEKLRNFKTRLPSRKDQAFFLTVKNDFIENIIHFSQLRLFPNIPAARFEFRVHEQISGALNRAGVALVQTDISINHTGYHSVAVVRKKLERNLEIVESELKNDPDNPSVHLQAGRTLEGLDRLPEAILHIEKVVATPDLLAKQSHLYWNAVLLLGRYYNMLQRYEEAETILRKLAQDFPKDDLIHYFLSESLMGSKKYSQAVEELKRCLDKPFNVGVFPLNLELVRFNQHYYLGLVYKELGQLDLARELLVKSLGMSKEDYKSRMSLGSLDLLQSRYAEAVEEYEQVIRQSPSPSAGNYANLGLAYRKLGRSQEAETAFLKSLEINPNQIEALTQLGYLYQDQKEHAKARDYFERGRTADPSLIDVSLALAQSCWRTRSVEKTIQECEHLLRERFLPTNLKLNGFEDLAGLFATIGDSLLQENRREVANQAYRLSFLIYPLPEVLQKILAGSDKLESYPIIEESLTAHANDVRVIHSLQSVLQNFPGGADASL